MSWNIRDNPESGISIRSKESFAEKFSQYEFASIAEIYR